MRVAFYAPLKPPGHPTPSGDRTMARLLISALETAGFGVELASTLRTFDPGGSGRHRRLAALSARLAARIIARYRERPPPERPALWFTYHLYHKAPDWLGPPVCRALNIPYVVAEASSAAKQRHGPWALGHAAAADAIRAADLIVTLNSADTDGIRPLLTDHRRLRHLRPFIDTRAFAQARRNRSHHRAALAARYELDPGDPILLTVAMMRGGDKAHSYRLLGEAMSTLTNRRWTLIVAGDGPAEQDVRASLALVAGRVIWAGGVGGAGLPALYAACDMYVWPAMREAYGLALLEAQAAGLPVVAGRSGGVPDVVADGDTGLLPTAGDPHAFASAVASLLDDAPRRQAMGRRAAARVCRSHDLAGASRQLSGWLAGMLPPEIPLQAIEHQQTDAGRP